MGSVVYLLEKDMSKKLLALLVAVSTCCAFGCSDDDSDSCKTGEKRCDGNMTQTCVSGNWSKGTPCAKGCDKATGVCKPEDPTPCTTDGEKRCDGKQLQVCKGGNWSKLEDCKGSCDEAKKECKVDGGNDTTVKEGDPCDKSTFQQVCINGGANALVCWDDVVKQWNCANNDCKANADKPLQVICAKGESKPTETTCTGEKVTTGGAVGTCCDKDTYQQTCTDGNAHALVCWDGAVKQWNCANNDCKANTEKPLQVVCAKGDSEPGTTQCNGDPKESGGAVGDCCNKDKYAPDCTGMLRCSNGVIKAISCKDGKSCKLNTDGTCSVESGNYCKDGKYDKTKYPLGYFECV